jgi:hypothetical protein
MIAPESAFLSSLLMQSILCCPLQFQVVMMHRTPLGAAMTFMSYGAILGLAAALIITFMLNNIQAS